MSTGAHASQPMKVFEKMNMTSNIWHPRASCRGLFSALTLALVALCSSASAQGGDNAPQASQEAGNLADQLDMDITPIPTGMGAIFVPTLTRAEIEPQVIVYFQGERVAWGRTGERIILPPGEYTATLGHGPVGGRPSTTVRVIDGVTSPVDFFFAALRVTAVDPEGNPVALRYTLESARNNTVWGEGRTTGEGSDYKSTRTWILPAEPVVLALDGNPSDRSAITVPLAEGQLVRYRLVVERGRIVRSELAEREIIREERWWRLRWVLGGDFSFNRSAGQLGAFNGDSFRLSLFTRASVGVDSGNHLALLNLSINESFISFESIDGQELAPQKLADEARAELLYNYRVGRIAGPYARAMARTAFFETNIRPPRDLTLELTDADDNEETIALSANNDFRTFGAFAPLEIREGAGLALSFVDNEIVTLGIRLGFGARQATYDEGIFIQERDGEVLRGVRLSDDNSIGPEAALTAGLRLGQIFSYEVSGDFYLPTDQLKDFNDIGDLTMIFRVDNTFALSFNSFLAMVYDLNIRREAFEIKDAQLSHMLSLRLQHTLF